MLNPTWTLDYELEWALEHAFTLSLVPKKFGPLSDKLVYDIPGAESATLAISKAGFDGSKFKIQAEVWSSDKLLVNEAVRLDTDKARGALVAKISDALSTYDKAAVQDILLTLSASLPQQAGKLEAPGDEPAPVDAAALLEAGKSVLESPTLIGDLEKKLEECGLAGERDQAVQLYLACTARLNDEPIPVVIYGASSSGKNHLVKKVLQLFPQEAYDAKTSTTPKYIPYCPANSFTHKVFVIFEAAGFMNDYDGAYILRSLISEGSIEYGTVQKMGDTIASVTVKQAGPITLVTTTTKGDLETELENRMLRIFSDDSPEQTRAVVQKQAHMYDGTASVEPDVSAWLAAQRWLATQDQQVVVPFAGRVADLIPAQDVAVRRAYPRVIGLVQASARLHQLQRETDADNKIVASRDDYELVYKLINTEFEVERREGLTPAMLTVLEVMWENGGEYELLLDKESKGDKYVVKKTEFSVTRIRELYNERLVQEGKEPVTRQAVGKTLGRLDQLHYIDHPKEYKDKPHAPYVLGDKLEKQHDAQVKLPTPAAVFEVA